MGALTVGLGAALASGSGIAQAGGPSGDDSATTAHTSAPPGNSTTSSGTSAGSSATPATGATTKPTSSGSTSTPAHPPSHAKNHSRSTTANSAAADDSRPATHLTVPAPASAATTVVPGGHRSRPSINADLPATTSQPATTVLPAHTAETSAAPAALAQVSTAAPLAHVSTAAVSTTTTSTSMWGAPLKLVSGILTLLGANPQSPTAPANPLGSLLWGAFREFETRVGLAPPAAGTPTVGSPDPTTGVVTGTLNATEQANLPLSYTVSTAPTLGTATVSPTGTFTYTPSKLARQDASVGGPTSDSFTVTVTDGLAGTNESVTVPIAPLAGGNAASVIATIPVGNGPFPVAVSPNGSFAYVGNEGSDTVSVINTATNTVTATIPIAGPPVAVAFNPNSTLAYVANNGGIAVVDTATNTVTTTIPNPNGQLSPTAVALSPDGAQAYVSYSNGTVAVVNTAADAVTTTIAVGGNAQGVAVSPNGTRVYVVDNPGSAGGNGSVAVIDTSNNTVTTTIPVGIAPVGVAVSPDGGTAYVTNSGAFNITNTVSVINTATNTVTTTIPIGDAGISEPIGVAVSPDGTQAYVANYGQNTVAVIDTASNTVITTIPINGPSGPATTPFNGTNPYGLAFSPDGSYVYVTDSNSNTVSVISTGA